MKRLIIFLLIFQIPMLYSQKKYNFRKGCVEGNCKNGYGTYSTKFFKGDLYIGNFKNSTYNGKGKYIWEDGDVFTGIYESAVTVKRVSGKYEWVNGDTYEGDYTSEAFFSYMNNGIFRSHNGWVYEGDVVNNMKEGNGTFIHLNGAIFS